MSTRAHLPWCQGTDLCNCDEQYRLFDDAEKIEHLEGRVDELERELAEVTEQRDAAFRMSRCECQRDECCANLVRWERENRRLREALETASNDLRRLVLDDAVIDCEKEQAMNASRQARAALAGENAESIRDAQEPESN